MLRLRLSYVAGFYPGTSRYPGQPIALVCNRPLAHVQRARARILSARLLSAAN